MLRISALLSLLLSATPSVACEATNTDVERAISGADQAFDAMDAEAFADAIARAETALACLTEAITPTNAAAFHGMHAVGAFLERDADTAGLHFRAALAADSAYRPKIAELKGHPLEQIYSAAAGADPSKTDPVPLPEGTQLLVWGAASEVRPIEIPAVYQLLDTERRVLWNGHLAGPVLLPASMMTVLPQEDEPSEPSAVISVEQTARPQPRKSLTAPLAIGTGIAAAAATGFLLTSNASYARYNDPATPFEDLDALRARTNGTMTAAGVGAFAAVGLGVATIAVQF